MKQKSYQKLKEKETPWTITMTLTIPNDGSVTEEEIKKCLQIAEKHKVFLEEMDKERKDLDKYPVAMWQISKSREMREAFYSNMKLDYTPQTISMTTSYTVDLPNDWVWGNVMDWADGFNLLHKEFLAEYHDTIDTWPASVEQKSYYDRVHSLLKIFNKEQKMEIKKGNKILFPLKYINK